MAKPERHLWPYGPQWNYYPPHVLNFPKIPYPNGPQVNVDSNENYLSIRCPEPRRPYHVPYSSFTSYCHQENHPAHPYMPANSVYTPKQYVYRPISQENINTSHKVNENMQSYPACSNYSFTKDQTACYQTTWNNTSHFQRNPPELDVRHFLATWQDKDDDFVDVSTENEQTPMYQANDPIPLDCSKRNNNDKSTRKSYNDNLLIGQPLNATGYIVQPFYSKDDTLSLNRTVVSEELNNNVPHRNNLNHGNHHQSYSKNFYVNPAKFPANKLLPCEYNLSYNSPLNHCDNNNSQFRSTMNHPRQKELVIDSSERSQYHLSSSLESGELFCDINPRIEDNQKPPIIHPIFNDSSLKINNVDEHCYFGNETHEFSENLMLTDFHSLKESWDVSSTNLKTKDNLKVFNNSRFVNKVSPQNVYEHSLSNNTNSTNNNNGVNINKNTNSIAYEGAFNILPNLTVNTSNPVQLNSTNCVVQSHESIKPTVTKHQSNVTKTVQANTKIRPYQFNEEISSEDIDISIASSGDFLAEEEHSSICCTSVISFSKTKKEKSSNVPQKNVRNNIVDKNDNTYSCLVVNDKVTSCALNKELYENKNKFKEFLDETDQKPIDSDKKSYDSEGNLSTAKSVAIDLSVLKSQNKEVTIPQIEKDPLCFLDFETTNFEQKTTNKLNNLSQVKNNLPQINSEQCENSITKPQEKILSGNEKLNNCNLIQESSFSLFEDPPFHIDSPDKMSANNSRVIPNDNLLLLAHCSQEYGCQITKEQEPTNDDTSSESNKPNIENHSKSVRSSVIKCSLRWDRIFNIMSNEDNLQPDMSLDLGPAKVELRMPSDNCSSNHWKIVEADNKIQTSSIVQVKRLILKRKNQSEERIPKMIIKKTEGHEYRSYLKKESNKAVLHCEKLKIYCDRLSKSPEKLPDN